MQDNLTHPEPSVPGAVSPRLLFVSHEASRTGAPMVLLHFLRWLREHTTVDFEILLLAGGPLAEDFEALAPTHRVEAFGTGPAAYIEAGIAKAGFPEAANRLKVARARRSLRSLGRYDVVYFNSTTSSFGLQVVDHRDAMVISHVHELQSAFTYWFPARDRSAMLDATDWYVACADAVADNLVVNFDVPAERVSCHHEFVVLPKVDRHRGAALRAELGLPAGVPLVGAAGMAIWRKGPDLFIEAAASLLRRHPDLDAHFVWIGSPSDEPIPIAQDIARLGVADRVHFVGEVVDPIDLYAELDVFCLTSREDPFPLVMLEAAGVGTPVVSFPNGGVVELAGPDDPATRRAVIVPYLDVDGMADAVAELLVDDEARRALGRRGQQRVRSQHTVETAAPALYADLVDRVATTTGATLPAAAPGPGPGEVIDLPSASKGGARRRRRGAPIGGAAAPRPPVVWASPACSGAVDP